MTKRIFSVLRPFALSLALVSLLCLAPWGPTAPQAARAAGLPSGSSQVVTTPLITFNPPDITFTYGENTVNGSLMITNIGDGAAADVDLAATVSRFARQ